jgi:hypothetical protein
LLTGENEEEDRNSSETNGIDVDGDPEELGDRSFPNATRSLPVITLQPWLNKMQE